MQGQEEEEEVGDDGDRDGARACDAGVGRGARCPRPPANVRFLCNLSCRVLARARQALRTLRFLFAPPARLRRF